MVELHLETHVDTARNFFFILTAFIALMNCGPETQNSGEVLSQSLTNAAPTAGPGAWSSNQTWAADSAHGGNLQGYFYWPASQTTLNGKRALVLVLHGCSQTAANDVIDVSTGYNWAATAERYGAKTLCIATVCKLISAAKMCLNHISAQRR